MQKKFKQHFCRQLLYIHTIILNLYNREGESAKQPNSNLVGVYLGTYPSAPVHKKTFSILQ